MRSYLLRNRLSEDLDVAQVFSFLAVAEEHTSAPVDDMRNHEVRMEVASFSLSLLYSKAIYVLMLALITWGGGGGSGTLLPLENSRNLLLVDLEPNRIRETEPVVSYKVLL